MPTSLPLEARGPRLFELDVNSASFRTRCGLYWQHCNCVNQSRMWQLRWNCVGNLQIDRLTAAMPQTGPTDSLEYADGKKPCRPRQGFFGVPFIRIMELPIKACDIRRAPAFFLRNRGAGVDRGEDRERMRHQTAPTMTSPVSICSWGLTSSWSPPAWSPQI